MSTGTGELSVAQRQVLQATYDWFRETGDWPHAKELDRLLDRAAGLDVVDVAPSISSSLIQWDGSGRAVLPNGAVKLTIAGIAACQHSEEDLDLFLRILQFCVSRERDAPLAKPVQEAEVVVSHRDIAILLDVQGRRDAESEMALHKAYELLLVSGDMWNHASSGAGGAWAFILDRRIRRYRGVDSIQDFLVTRAKEATQPSGLGPTKGEGLRSVEAKTGPKTTGGDRERDPGEGMGIGLGIAAGAVTVFFVAPIVLHFSSGWRTGSFVTGSILGSLGVGGALMDYATLRSNDAYHDWGVSAFAVLTGLMLIGLQRSGAVAGGAGGVCIAIGLFMLLVAMSIGGTGVSKFIKWRSNALPTSTHEILMPPSESPGRTADRKRMTRYECLTLVVATVGVLATLIGVFRGGG